MVTEILKRLYENPTAGLEVTLVEVSVLAVLTGYLCIRIEKRARAHSREQDTANWTGKAIDATVLKPAVERARRDGWRPSGLTIGGCFHKALMRLMRRNLTRFEYFQDRKSEEHLQA